MQKLQIEIPLPIQGINCADDSLISDHEAADGTVNISFKNGMPQTRKGYIKQLLYAHTGESNGISRLFFHYVAAIKRMAYVASTGTVHTLFQMNESKDPIKRTLGVVGSAKPVFLPISCALGNVTYLTVASRNLTVASLLLKTFTVDEAISADEATALAGRKIFLKNAIYTIASATAGDPGGAKVTVTEAVVNAPGDGDIIYPNVAYSEKVFVADQTAFQWYDESCGLLPIPPYTPDADEISAYGTNVLTTTPDEINKQKYILLDNNRIWLAGYGQIVRLSHAGDAGTMPDYWPSTHVFKLSEDCTGMVSFMGEVILFTENTATLIAGDTIVFTSDGYYTNTQLPGGYGCSAHDSIVVGDNAVYWANKGGIFRYRYLPSGYSIPECISEFMLSDGHTRTIRKKLDEITDWTKVFAVFHDHEYRLSIGGGQVLVFDTISSTWAFYDYHHQFGCGCVYQDKLYFGGSTSDGATTPKFWIYHMDYPFDPLGTSYNGLSDDGTAISSVLKSKFFDFAKAANKKRFKRLYFTIYSELVSYDIDLIVNMDNEEQTMASVISSKISRWGNDTPSDDLTESAYAVAYGDELNTLRTNLNYPVRLRHRGKKYNIQYELKSDGMNHAWLLKAIVLMMKMKELK